MHQQEVNGIISQAKTAKAKSAHAQVFEQMQVEEIMCAKGNKSLIEYLQEKHIIGSEIGEETGEYQINIQNLLEQDIEFGKGQATESTKKDIYMLEEQEETNSMGESVYLVKYYGNKLNETEILGRISGEIDSSKADLKKLKNYFEGEKFSELIVNKEFIQKPGDDMPDASNINRVMTSSAAIIIEYNSNYYQINYEEDDDDGIYSSVCLLSSEVQDMLKSGIKIGMGNGRLYCKKEGKVYKVFMEENEIKVAEIPGVGQATISEENEQILLTVTQNTYYPSQKQGFDDLINGDVYKHMNGLYYVYYSNEETYFVYNDSNFEIIRAGILSL